MIKQCSFEKIKPFFVRKIKDSNTYCCVYCIQMLILKDVFNSTHSDSFGNMHYHANAPVMFVASQYWVKCIAREHRFDGITHVWESCLCTKMQDSPYHQYKCLMGECNSCGVKRLMVCPREWNDNTKTISV